MGLLIDNLLRSYGYVPTRFVDVENLRRQNGGQRNRRRGEVEDLEFQIRELRSVLARSEEELEREVADRRKIVSELGPRADDLEALLLERATRFCMPLRNRRELSPLFQELESDAQA